MEKLHIDHLNYYLGGGAAIAARRVHEGLAQAGHDSRFWYLKGDAPPDATYHIWRPEAQNRTITQDLTDPQDATASQDRRAAGKPSWLQSIRQRWQHFQYRRQLRRALKGRPSGLEIFSPAVLPHRQQRTADQFDGNVLHLHWLGAGIDYAAFFAALEPNKPVVWTLHDMNPLTGGCHYAGDCQRHQAGCGNCPQLGKPGVNDLSARSFEAKRKSIPHQNLHIAAPSQWLLDLAQASPLLKHAASFQLIRYGIDLQVFQPVERQAARQRLGLPANARIIAFGADDVDNRRKGFQPMCETLRLLADEEDLMCVYFGRGNLPDDVGGMPIKSLGFVSDKAKLAEIYSAANLFVMPSLEDNSPQTGIESIACGTPVISFQAGGIPDYVLPGVSGALAEVGNATALAEEVRAMLRRQQAGEDLRASSRETACRLFAPATQAESYEQLYRQALGQASRSKRQSIATSAAGRAA